MADEERWTDYVDVEQLEDATRNPKGHDVDEMAKSLSRFGYVEQITLDERTGRIVSGHGRRDDVLRRKHDGLDPPRYVKVDGDRWLVPVSRGWQSADDDEAEAYVLAANKVGEGIWQRDPLYDMLRDLDARGQLDGTGFSTQSIADLQLLAAPALDPTALAAHVGEPTERDFWPVLRLLMSPADKARFDNALAVIGVDLTDNDAVVHAIIGALS